MRWSGVAFWLAWTVLAMAGPARAQIDPKTEPIAAFVAEVDKGLRAAHDRAQGDVDKLRDGCRDVLTRALDIAAMARDTAEQAWERMSDTQHDVYQAAFLEQLAADCLKQMASHVGDPARIAGVRTTSDGDKLAAVRIGTADNSRIVTWRMRRDAAGKWTAVDILWEGRSTVAAAREKFAAVLAAAGGNIDAILERMRK